MLVCSTKRLLCGRCESAHQARKCQTEAGCRRCTRCVNLDHKCCFRDCTCPKCRLLEPARRCTCPLCGGAPYTDAESPRRRPPRGKAPQASPGVRAMVGRGAAAATAMQGTIANLRASLAAANEAARSAESDLESEREAHRQLNRAARAPRRPKHVLERPPRCTPTGSNVLPEPKAGPAHTPGTPWARRTQRGGQGGRYRIIVRRLGG